MIGRGGSRRAGTGGARRAGSDLCQKWRAFASGGSISGARSLELAMNLSQSAANAVSLALANGRRDI